MFKKLIILFSFFFCSLLIANVTNKEAAALTSKKPTFKSKLECQDEYSVGSFQKCWLKLLRNSKPVKNAQIYIDGGMPQHNHGLPTSPEMNWSEEKQAYLIHGLKFSMPGKWSLNFIINVHNEKLQDEINMEIEVN